MNNSPRIAFLHIPKTAGQSLHHQISSIYSKDEICPARTNQQLYELSMNDLKKYKFFSGHLDWSIIKNAGPFDFSFTVLRDPVDRICSFYFYLLKEAFRFEKLGTQLPPGLSHCKDSSLQNYFDPEVPHLKTFIDNHYSNFYSNYLASGSYCGHEILGKHLSDDQLLDAALSNSHALSKIYSLSSIEQISLDISSLFSVSLPRLTNINQNKSSGPAERTSRLNDISGGWDWSQKFHEFTKIDYKLLDKLSIS